RSASALRVEWDCLPPPRSALSSLAEHGLTASRRIIDVLVAEGIGRVCIGKNPLWKQEVRMGRRNNQDVVQVPHARFIEMVAYKAEVVGIQVCITEESYTSKANYLDAASATGLRRGGLSCLQWQAREAWALSSRHGAAHQRRCERLVQHTLCKVLPDCFGLGIAGTAVCPVRLPVPTRR